MKRWEIQAALKRARNREQFERHRMGSVGDLRRALLDHQPAIVHFSGHGSGSTGLALENNSGQNATGEYRTLAGYSSCFRGKLSVSCSTPAIQKLKLRHQYIDCVIGMNRTIGMWLQRVCHWIYDALGAGNSYEDF